MSATLTDTGLTIEAFQTILEAEIDDFGGRVGLTAGRIANLKEDLQSVFGNMFRIDAELQAAMQETLLAVYETLSLEASGVHLDRAVRLLGIERTAAVKSQVTGTLTGTPSYSVTDGVRFQFDDSDGDLDDETTWLVVDGPYTIGGGGTVTVTLEAEDDGALAPGVAGVANWTLLDSIAEITSYESTAQPIVGNDSETDAELRTRARIEAYSRAQGPLAAIEASVSAVDGVTFVRAWDNPTDTTDADSIPARAINVVAEGGTDAAVASAIESSRPAGARLFGLTGATQVEETVSLGSGRDIIVQFNRVEEVEIWIDVVLTTSTAEEPAPSGITDTVAALMLTKAAELFGIGDDVSHWKLEGAIYAAGYPGIDNAVVTLSTDGTGGGGGSTDPYTTTKRVITIRQKPTFDAARIAVSEA